MAACTKLYVRNPHCVRTRQLGAVAPPEWAHAWLRSVTPLPWVSLRTPEGRKLCVTTFRWFCRYRATPSLRAREKRKRVVGHGNCDFVRVRRAAIFRWLGAFRRGDGMEDKPDFLLPDCATLSSRERMANMWTWHLTPWRSTTRCGIGIDATSGCMSPGD
jgi:hypothetical protein